MSTVSVMVSYVCPVFNMWLEYPKLLLLFLIACICSLHLLWNVLPVCPMYFSGQSRHFIWYMPLLLYLSVCEWCFTMLCIVFCIPNVIFFYILEQFCDFSCFFSAACKSRPFCFSVLWTDVCILFLWVRVLWYLKKCKV
jgi:hypothetical protein